MTADKQTRRLYWRRNLMYLGALLSIWFLVSYGCGILFVEELNQIRLGGFKLGFWFAQQGAIYVFVVLIFVYVFLMNRLDRQLVGQRAGGGPDNISHDDSSPAAARSGDRPGA